MFERPAISVIMPVYNPEKTQFSEAVNSILSQTFNNFEFLIVDDGSTFSINELLLEFDDDRIKLIFNGQNKGISYSMNRAISESKGKYIARMDCDDISMPERFEKQYTYMENHPEISVCGTFVQRFIVENGEKKEIDKRHLFKDTFKNDMDAYAAKMLFTNPGPTHPTAFFRKAFFESKNIKYDESKFYAQDYKLWLDVYDAGGLVYIIPEKLLWYRVHDEQISVSKKDIQSKYSKQVQKELLERLFDKVSDEESDFHHRYATGYYYDVGVPLESIKWFGKILDANRKKRVFNQKKLIYRVFISIMRNAVRKLLCITKLRKP